MAKSIRCSQCGATDLNKINDQEYTCLYCRSRIVLEKPKIDLGNFIRTMNPNTLSPSQTTYTPSGQILKSPSKLGCVLALVILTSILSAIVVPIIMVFSKGAPSVAGQEKNTWNLSYIQQVFYAHGSKGGAVWIFSEENYNWEKLRTKLTILDPVTGKTRFTDIVIPEHKSTDQVKSTWDLFSGGKVFGDSIFFTQDNKGIEVRNIYSGKRIMVSEDFQKIMGARIANVYAYPNNEDPYISIKSAEGLDYLYFPGTKTVLERDAYNKKSREEKVEKYYFALAGRNERKSIMRVKQEVEKNARSGFFHASSLSEFKDEKQYYVRNFHIQSVDSLPVNHPFFNAEFITWDDTSVVVKYKMDLLDDSPLVIARYGLSGKQIWNFIPAKAEPFKKMKKSENRFDITLAKSAIIISANATQKCGCSIDINSGKILWKYLSPEK